MAILVGDALLTRAFALLAELPGDASPDRVRRRVDALSLLGRACGTAGLIGGQVGDLEAEGRDVDDAALQRIHRAKTGALLAACVEGACVLSGAEPSLRQALAAYGQAIGLAFQVVDDVLDATEEAAQLGKTAGKDSAAAKATYVRLHGVDGARARAASLLEEALHALAPLGARADELRAMARLVVERRA
jgi:geranylgeranyl pyrophosphate synthase